MKEQQMKPPSPRKDDMIGDRANSLHHGLAARPTCETFRTRKLVRLDYDISRLEGLPCKQIADEL